MYYKFYPEAVKTEAGFTQEIDGLCREIGERGKSKSMPEGVPPPLVHTQSPPHEFWGSL